MPGLMDMSKPTGDAAPAAAAEGAPPRDPSKYVEEGESNVSPEEQAQYEQFVNNSYQLLYQEGQEGGEVRPEVLESLQVGEQQGEGPNPAIMALAQTAVNVVTQLDDSARQAGSPITDDVLYHGATAVIEELAEIAQASQLYDFSEEEMGGALMQAIDLYRPKLIADGRTSEETLKSQFDEVNQAEAAGKLGDVLPGLGPQTVGEPPVQQG
jgi:hypothetical protein